MGAGALWRRASAGAAGDEEAAVIADPGHGPGVAVGDGEVAVVASGGDPVTETEAVIVKYKLRGDFPDDVLAAAFAESRKLYDEYAASNENFRKIYEHWSAYWTRQQQWLRVAELPYDFVTSGQAAAASATRSTRTNGS